MGVEKKHFGILSTGEDVDLFVLRSGAMSVLVSSYGGAITSLLLPAAKGKRDDVVLGFSALAPYTTKHPYFGVIVGRYANRIGSASFNLQGKTHALAKNDGQNSLHGGWKGFDKVVWHGEANDDAGRASLLLTHRSPDGDEGYPGNLDAQILYALDGQKLTLTYRARCDQATPVSLTNHSYFNLKGEGQGLILDHEATLHARAYLPVDQGLIPTGEIRSVEGTALDFRLAKPVGKDIEAAGGYDHCFVLDHEAGVLGPAATVREPTSGRTLRVLTTQPGLQFYTGNKLRGVPGKRGGIYDQYAGFCLETQAFPDAPNKPGFPGAILYPGQQYEQITVFAFEW